MKFTDYLFEEVNEIWNGYLEHPFVKEIGEGILNREKFKNYLIQDYLYLKEYIKVYAIGITKANGLKEMKFFYEAIEGIIEDEAAVHIKYLKDFGISKEEAERYDIEIPNLSYTSYMQSVALKGNIKEIAMAVMPCTWSYNYIGKKLYEKYKNNLDNNFYKPWIESYESEGYTEFTNKWIDYINEICKDVSGEEKKNLLDIFIKSSIYEMDFWNMAYKKEM
ncbi:thiaminase II [Clostridium cylindrosporum]|uniref:Aminopyrimidine aminohydrolase n=1 Tax=Clostridium cylindrosporum DSM 605 TaxID=1121307 RepID=A0A0J8D843_CLOCY|nr:thiaminase II [Clostridium cylindrosporum]KMT22027.1 transcriptional activator, TenA [Clostridium cylindrosporum DSM 605]